MYRKLNLDRDKVDQCRSIAGRILSPVHRYVEHHSSFSIEAATLAFLGVDGKIDRKAVLNSLGKDALRRGVCHWLARVMISEKCRVREAAEKIAKQKVDFKKLAEPSPEEMQKKLKTSLSSALRKLDESRAIKHKLQRYYLNGRRPFAQFLVEGENFKEISSQALQAAKAGADIICIASAEADFLLEGSNIAKLQKLLDAETDKQDRLIRLSLDINAERFLELTVQAAFARVDFYCSDPIAGALFEDIHAKSSFVDQYFAKLIAARAGMTVFSRDQVLQSKIDAHRQAQQAIVSVLLNDEFSQLAGVAAEQMILPHIFSINAERENSLLLELAHAQIMRELFTRSSLLFIPPPAQHAYQDWIVALFHFIGMISEQGTHVVSVQGETLAENWMGIKALNYLSKAAKSAGDELLINSNGIIARRAHTLLENTLKLLKKIESQGLFNSLEEGIFASTKSAGAKGSKELFQRDKKYFNPVIDALRGK